MTSAKKGTQNSPKSTTATTKRRAAFADDERVATRARLKSDERETQPPRDDQRDSSSTGSAFRPRRRRLPARLMTLLFLTPMSTVPSGIGAGN